MHRFDIFSFLGEEGETTTYTFEPLNAVVYGSMAKSTSMKKISQRC